MASNIEALNSLDAKVTQNAQLLENDGYAQSELLRLSVEQLKKAHDFDFNTTDLKAISRLIMKEYLDEFNGKVPA